MKGYKRFLVLSASVAVLFCGALLSIAYNTDSGSLRNDIEVARTNITVVEEKWDEQPDTDGNGVKDPAEEIVQGKELPKDPAILNESTLDMYCFASVQIPVRTVMTVEAAPQRVKTQLFSYQLNANWVELSRSEVNDSVEILYGYRNPVSPNKKTGTIFDKIKYANVVEGEIARGDILEVRVTGYGIQSKGFSSMQEAFDAFDWNQSAMVGGK